MSDEQAWLEAVDPPPEGELVVAVSGGPDSAFLAWAMSQLATPRLVHVHHGTESADRLASAVRTLAGRLDKPIEIIEVEVPEGASWEGQARTVRIEALRRSAGDAVIATGHHADDQAETMLGNLLRGSGARGLAAMHVPRPGWVRPLLGMTRERIREAADALGLPYVDDPSNLSLDHTRNRIRHTVLPELEAMSPGVSGRLVAASIRLAADDEALERAAGRLRLVDDGVCAVLSVHELAAVARPVAARAVRRALRAVHGTYPGTASDVEAALDVASGRRGRTTVGSGIIVQRDRGELVLVGPDAPPERWDAVKLAIPGRVEVGRRWVAAHRDTALPTGPRRAILDAPALGDHAIVRRAAVGDRIDIGGGSKPLSDALREAAVPLRDRSMWPVVDAGGRIAWLVGIRAAAWARPTGGPGVVFETGVI